MVLPRYYVCMCMCARACARVCEGAFSCFKMHFSDQRFVLCCRGRILCPTVPTFEIITLGWLHSDGKNVKAHIFLTSRLLHRLLLCSLRLRTLLLKLSEFDFLFYWKTNSKQYWLFPIKLSHLFSFIQICIPKHIYWRSQWPRGLRRRSTAARLLRSWVRIPPGTWMFVCCECCVLSGRADHSSRGGLPTVVCRCVWSRNHKNPREWGGGQGPLGAIAPRKKKAHLFPPWFPK